MGQLQRGDALGASYRLVDRIGAGAAGDVWTVEPVDGGELQAAKILKAEHVDDSALVERFVRERSVLLGLRHESIVAVHDLIVEGTTLAIVMELLPGGSLRDLLDRTGPLPAADALALCAQVCSALAIAHDRGITHRDIKPDNVLLAQAWQPGQRGSVRVTDFGIASVVSERNRRTTGLLGTPQYMAPELISEGHTTPAADLYATGVMLYELLAGRTPFAGTGTDFTVAYRHITAVPPKLDLPDALWSSLAALLDKDPHRRPTASEAAVELDRLARRCNDLPALSPAPDPETFDEPGRPATMLRGELVRRAEELPRYESELSAHPPTLGEAPQQTLLRPMTPRVAELRPEAALDAPAPDLGGRITKKSLLLGATGLLLLGGLGAGIAVMFGGGEAEAQVAASEIVQVSQQDPVLPTGLTTSRSAEFDPDTGTVTLEVTLAAQKAPLTGPFLQVVPATDEGACPSVRWEGATGAKHQASTSGLTVACGWALDGIEVPANGQVSMTAEFRGAVSDADELDAWLGRAASATSAALSDPESLSTAYPVQRLQSIVVQVPSRTVSQTPLEVTLLPVWPTGTDELNPLLKSPATGTPSQMLQSFVGDDDPVRFADGCSGAVSVAPDGLTVTALSVTRDCRLRASVGNFTNLESNPFSITTRD